MKRTVWTAIKGLALFLLVVSFPLYYAWGNAKLGDAARFVGFLLLIGVGGYEILNPKEPGKRGVERVIWAAIRSLALFLLIISFPLYYAWGNPKLGDAARFVGFLLLIGVGGYEMFHSGESET